MKTLTINQINGQFHFAKEVEFAGFPVNTNKFYVGNTAINIDTTVEYSYPSYAIKNKTVMIDMYSVTQLDTNAKELWDRTTESLINAMHLDINNIRTLEADKYKALREEVVEVTEWALKNAKNQAKQKALWQIILGQPSLIVFKTLDCFTNKMVSIIKQCLRNNIDVEIHCFQNGHYILNAIDWNMAMSGKAKGRYQRCLPWSAAIKSEVFKDYNSCVKAAEKFTKYVHTVEMKAEYLLNKEMAQFMTDRVAPRKEYITEFIYEKIEEELSLYLEYVHGEMRPASYVWNKTKKENFRLLNIWARAFGIDFNTHSTLDITPGAYRPVRPEVYMRSQEVYTSNGFVTVEKVAYWQDHTDNHYDGYTERDENFVMGEFNSLQKHSLQASSSRKYNLKVYDSKKEIMEKAVQIRYYLQLMEQGVPASDLLDDRYAICPDCGMPYQKMQYHCGFCKHIDGRVVQNVNLAHFLGLKMDEHGRLEEDYDLPAEIEARLYPAKRF